MKNKPPVASGIPVHCKHDRIVPAAELKLYPGNYRKHPPKQLDRMLRVIQGDQKRPGNGWRRAIVVSTLSGLVTKGNGFAQMAQRHQLDVPVEMQTYRNRAEEIRDLVADNRLSELAHDDDDALRKLLGELDAAEVELAAVSTDELEKLLAETDVPAGEFEITAKLHEHYDYVLIFTTNETDFANLQTLAGIRPEKSYKKTGVGLGRAISFERFLGALGESGHPVHVARRKHDDAQAPAKRRSVGAPKSARRLPASRRK